MMDGDMHQDDLRKEYPLHTLWDNAVDQPGYDKTLWMELERKLTAGFDAMDRLRALGHDVSDLV